MIECPSLNANCSGLIVRLTAFLSRFNVRILKALEIDFKSEIGLWLVGI